MPEQINNPFSKLVDYLETQKQQNRALEDQEIDRKITLIHDLINAPGANPARTAEGISNLMELYGAKGGRGAKPQKGQGPWGKNETPMPSLLAGIIHGSIPFEGPTTEPVPAPQSPAQQGLMPEASAILPGLTHEIGSAPDPSTAARAQGFDGKDVLSSPVMVPPAPLQAPPEASRMLSAARDMQKYNEGPKTRPVANQPMMKSHEEMATEAAHDAALKTSESLKANMKAEFDTLVSMGVDPKQAQQTVMDKYGFKPQNLTAMKPQKGPIMQYTGPDGQPVKTQAYLQMLPDGSTRALDQYGLPLPPGAQPVPTGAANPFTTHWEQDTHGVWHVSYAAKDPNAGFQPQTLTTGMVGHLPPPPQGNVITVVDPNTNQPSFYRSQGNTAKPITIPGQDGAVTAVKPQPEIKMSAQGKQALTGLNVVGNMMDPLLADIKSIGLSNNPIGQGWDLMLARRGISPGKLEEDLLQSLGVVDVYTLKGLMGGRPNVPLMEAIRTHIPQPGDSTQLAFDKLNTLKTKIIPAVKKAITDAESTRIPQANPYGGGGVNSDGTTVPQNRDDAIMRYFQGN